MFEFIKSERLFPAYSAMHLSRPEGDCDHIASSIGPNEIPGSACDLMRPIEELVGQKLTDPSVNRIYELIRNYKYFIQTTSKDKRRFVKIITSNHE